jgi:hypothetical protein
MYFPLVGQPIPFRWFDVLPMMLAAGTSVYFVGWAFPEMEGWRENVVQGLAIWAVMMTYFYERLKWRYLKAKRRAKARREGSIVR